jgi:PAS domain S-box-containing protein
MKKPLRCLFVEDSEDDALLALSRLRSGGYDVMWERVETAEAMSAALGRQPWDFVLADYKMPRFSGQAALELLKASGLDLPFIIVSGTIGEDIAVEAMKAGAQDYIMKDRLTRLVPAVEREILDAAVRSERRRTEAALRASEERFRRLFECSYDAIMILEPPAWRFTAGNPAAVKIFGAQNEEQFVSHELWELSPDMQPDGRASAEKSREMIEAALLNGSHFFEWTHRRIGGEEFFADVHLTRMERVGGGAVIQATVRDITERKRATEWAQLARDTLELLNQKEGGQDMIHEILVAVKKTMGFEAVAIRLREGDDFPYYAIEGFPENFAIAERFLCARDHAGKIVRNGKGDPALECMCGNVLCGRIDPALPFFTEGGSFWSNGTTRLLAATKDADRQAHTRNRCNSMGYESVALIPLRAGEKVIGLLQLNDHRLNQFTVQMIHFFEGWGASIGIALSRQQAKEALRLAHERLRRFVDSNIIGIMTADSGGSVIEANDYYLRLLGQTKEELAQGKTNWRSSTPPEWLPVSEQALQELRNRGVCTPYEKEYFRPDGTRVPVYLANAMLPGPGEQFAAFAIDVSDQKQMEAALRREESLFNSLAGSIPDRIYFKDRQSRFIRINASMARRFGLRSPDDAVGKTDFDMFSEEHARQAYGDEQRIMEGGGAIVDQEEKETWPDGHVSWASSTKMPMRDAHGRVTGLVGISRDITERKAAETALRASTEQLAAALDQAHLAHWEKDIATGIYTLNDRFYALYGTTAEREGGYKMSSDVYVREFLLPEDQHIVADDMKSLLAGGVGELQVEHRIRRRDGEYRDMLVRITVVRDATDCIVGTRGVNQDITEHKREEEDLRKLSRIIEQAPLSVVITNLSGAIEYVNPRFCAVTGYTPEEVLGKNPRILKSGVTPPETYCDMWQKLTHSEIWSGGLCNRKKNGELYLETAVIAPVVGKNGLATHYVALKDDITAQRRFAEEIEAKLAKEHEVSEMKSRFISMISHEFRTPLTAAMASADLLHNHLDRLAPEKREELFSRINSSVLRLTEMLDDVLTLNRVDTENNEVRLGSIDLMVFLNDAAEEIRLGDHNAHRFEVCAVGDTTAFVTDTNLLRHIVSNLLSNSVRYSPIGTLVTIRTEADSARVLLSIEDQGIGIPEADRKRVFESFERGSNVGATKGTGLGLNIVKRMTELLSGTIAVDGVEGGGSRFTLLFPRLPVPARRHESS